MEIALQKFQDLFSSIGHEVSCRYQIKNLNAIFAVHISIVQQLLFLHAHS
jgi:hypothetical protein